MLTVKVELDRFGQGVEIKTLADISICNIGEGDSGYDYFFLAKFENSNFRPAHEIKGIVKNHDRSEHLGVLLSKVFDIIKKCDEKGVSSYYRGSKKRAKAIKILENSLKK